MMKINLIEYFEESVQRCPQKTAVIDRDRTITFSELRGKALVLASAIGCIKRPAAVFLNKSIESVYADLAIIYSGNFYMNLDVRYPAERLKNILDLVCPGVIITNNQYLKSIVSVIPSDVQVINLDGMDFTQQVDESAIFTNLGKLIDTDPLCIINTSGSTGTPKGVVLNHKSFFDFTEWALDTFKFDDNELMGSLSPLVFDIYSFELCMLMAKSSTLVVIPEHLSAFPASILKILEEHKVTFLFWVPTIMVNIANMDLLSSIQLPALKTVWFAGEVFPTKQFNYWRKMLPQTTLPICMVLSRLRLIVPVSSSTGKLRTRSLFPSDSLAATRISLFWMRTTSWWQKLAKKVNSVYVALRWLWAITTIPKRLRLPLCRIL